MTPERLKQIREQFAQAGFRPNQTQAKKVVAELCAEMDKLYELAESAIFYAKSFEMSMISLTELIRYMGAGRRLRANVDVHSVSHGKFKELEKAFDYFLENGFIIESEYGLESTAKGRELIDQEGRNKDEER